MNRKIIVLLITTIVVSSLLGSAFYVNRARSTDTTVRTAIVDICTGASDQTGNSNNHYRCADGQGAFSVTSYAWGLTSDISTNSVGFTFICSHAVGVGITDLELDVNGVNLATATGVAIAGVSRNAAGNQFEFNHFLSECAFGIVADNTSPLASGGTNPVTGGVNTLTITVNAGGIGFQSIRAVVAG
jgi:hypothetical protein